MARKKRAKKKEPKIDDVLLKAAKEAGFSKEQIKGMTPESLKAHIVQVKPELGARFYGEKQVEPKAAEPVTYEIGISEFEVSVLPGFVPVSSMAAKEQMEIERQLRRKGIPYRDVQEMIIERNMVKNANGRLVSIVSIKYRKEK